MRLALATYVILQLVATAGSLDTTLVQFPQSVEGESFVDSVTRYTFPDGLTVTGDHTCGDAINPKWHSYREMVRDVFILFAWKEENSISSHEGLGQLLSDPLFLYDSTQQYVDCPVGRLFLGLLAIVRSPYASQISLQEYLRKVLLKTNLTAVDIILSSWPVFTLLWQASSELGPHSADTDVFDRKLLVSALYHNAGNGESRFNVSARVQEVLASSALAPSTSIASATLVQSILDAHEQNQAQWQLLPDNTRQILMNLEPLSSFASDLVRPSGELSMLLGLHQEIFLRNAICPAGTRLMPVKSSPGLKPFRLCVRTRRIGLDAAALMHGDWDTCEHLRTWHREFVSALPEDERGTWPRRCTIVDVGSHIGMCSVAFAMQGCRVIAVDILTQHTEMIAASSFVNGIRHRIDVFNVGISNVSGYASVLEADGPHETALANISSFPDDSTPSSVVPVLTVPQLLKALDIDPSEVTMLKVDAEGHDLEILSGAFDVLTGPASVETGQFHWKGPLVVYEDDPIADRRARTQGLLESWGYKVMHVNKALNYAIRRSH